MRISKLEIGRWRNLSELNIELDANADFICLVGANGAGKSNLLELVAYAAPQFGLTSDHHSKRQFPFQRQQPYEITVTLDLEEFLSLEELDTGGIPGEFQDQWDGTLVFCSEGKAKPLDDQVPELAFPFNEGSNDGPYYRLSGLFAGGIANPHFAFQFATAIRQALSQRGEVLFLYIDAERVFPEVSVTDAEVLERSRQDWREPSIVRQQATIATQNLYLEWMRSLLGEQQRLQGEFWDRANEARLNDESQPVPVDLLEGYRTALRGVLPHLDFLRLDQTAKRLIYSSADSELFYEDLSGGERELAFLVGQMERFGVKNGLFLLDEPELHLNAELLHRWLAFLRSSTETGQVWIATHALEAVEAAGQTSTLVLDRDEDRMVRQIGPLGDRPALQTLAPLLGTPAFSLTNTTFILIEGDRPGRERERFAEVTGSDPSIRFVEGGGCEEVARKLGGLLLVASEAEQLRVGGFIDRDHRSQSQINAMTDATDVSVLPVHEIENFFLEPSLLQALVAQAGSNIDPIELVQTVTDSLAGRWIWQRVLMRKEWHDAPGQSHSLAHSLSWDQLVDNKEELTTDLLDPFSSDAYGESASQRRAALATTINEYASLREVPSSLWMEVEGKEVLREVAGALGFAEPEALESRAARLWRDGDVARSTEAASVLTEIANVPLRGPSS